MADSSSLLAQLATQAKDLIGTNSNEIRKDIIRTANKLQLALETPSETVLRMTWGMRCLDLSIQTAIAMKLFDSMSDNEPKTSIQLGAVTNSDPVFLSRLLKHMAAMDVINETSSDHYTHTKFSKGLTNPIYADAFPLYRLAVDRANVAAPEFFAKRQFQNPQDPMDCAFQAGINEKAHFFEFVGKNPEIGKFFNSHMVGYAQGRKSWIDPGCYPVEARLIEGADPDGVMLVDIGAGTGRDVNAFAEKYGKKCVLEELPDVAAVAVPSPNVEVLAHDMFKEQPIKGARAYYMHSVLHDWPEPKCVEILTAIKPAMKPGYSRLLINENVIPKENAYWMATGLDLIMMQVFASSERTEERWQQLLESVGMKLNKIYTYEAGSNSLIEAELA